MLVVTSRKIASTLHIPVGGRPAGLLPRVKNQMRTIYIYERQIHKTALENGNNLAGQTDLAKVLKYFSTLVLQYIGTLHRFSSPKGVF
eukprot:SAG11_NODE_12_length_27025_cov_37.402681_29_plen_88_part_00